MAIDTTVALITLADAKAFLKITGATEDGIVGDFINEVSQWVCDFVGRQLLSATYTEFYDGDGGSELVLKKSPVTALTSLNVDGERVWGAATAVDVAGSAILDPGAGIVRLWNQGGAFYSGYGNVKVVYTAGYKLATMPHSIQLAVRKLVAFLYRASYAQPRIGSTTETVGDRTTTFTNDPMLKDVRMMLEPYRGLIGGLA